jgi:SHS2 domain-containing protein
MGRGRFELMEHTGDIGLRIWAPTPEEIFALACRGWLSVVTAPESVSPSETRFLEAEATHFDELLIRWLNELNFLFSAEGWLPAEANIRELSPSRIRAAIKGEPFQPEKHAILREIKAATYHQLVFEERNGVWFAQVIFDI